MTRIPYSDRVENLMDLRLEKSDILKYSRAGLAPANVPVTYRRGQAPGQSILPPCHGALRHRGNDHDHHRGPPDARHDRLRLRVAVAGSTADLGIRGAVDRHASARRPERRLRHQHP